MIIYFEEETSATASPASDGGTSPEETADTETAEEVAEDTTTTEQQIDYTQQLQEINTLLTEKLDQCNVLIFALGLIVALQAIYSIFSDFFKGIL